MRSEEVIGVGVRIIPRHRRRERVRLAATGQMEVVARDRKTGRVKWRRRGPNTLTDDGLAFIARALTNDGPKLAPANQTLRCRVLRTAQDVAGGFNSGGPMTGVLRFGEDGSLVQNGGTPVEPELPTENTPVRLRFVDASEDEYALHSFQLHDASTMGSSTVLSTVVLGGSPADKDATEIVTFTYTLHFRLRSGVFAGTAAKGLLDVIGGGNPIFARVRRTRFPPPVGTIFDTATIGQDNAGPRVKGLAGAEARTLLAEIRYANPTMVDGVSRERFQITGFQLIGDSTPPLASFFNKNHASPLPRGTIVDYVRADGDPAIPAPGAGEVGWDVEIEIGAASGAALIEAWSDPVFVLMSNGEQAPIRVRAQGSAGNWALTPTLTRYTGEAFPAPFVEGGDGDWTVTVISPNSGADNSSILNLLIARGGVSLPVDLKIPLVSRA